MSIWVIFKLTGALALLMFGMKTMSDSLQKLAGPQLRHVLGAMTTNRFTGILTGMFVTSAVQSSTATTVMTVSFCQCRSADAGAGYLGYHGSQYRNNAYSLDHVGRILFQHW